MRVHRSLVILVLLAALYVVGAPAATAQAPYPPPEGPVEVLPTEIVRPAVAGDEQTLARSGADAALWAALALAAVALGVGALGATRSRRRSHEG